MLDPNPGLIVWTIVTFVCLLVILRSFAWKPLLGALQKREEGVRGTLERAEHAREEAERLLEEHRKMLLKSEAEAHRILNEGRELGEKLKNEIIEKANQQSRRLADQAKQEIERDKDAALAELRTEVANLAIKAAEKILDETLDEKKHRAIVDSFMNNLPKN